MKGERMHGRRENWLLLSNIILEIWSEWRLTVIAATVRIALVDIPAGVFLHPAVGWG